MKIDDKMVKPNIKETDPIIYYVRGTEKIKIDPRKDYRKRLTLLENATNAEIINACRQVFEYLKDEECLEAASVLIDPEARREYDIARKKLAMEKEAEKVKEAQMEDAKTKEEKKKKKAERKRNAKLAREKKRIEIISSVKKKNITKNNEKMKKREYEKIVESYDSNITAAYARNTIRKSSSRRVATITIIGALIGGSLAAVYINRDFLKEKMTTIFDKDKTNEINYDEDLSKVNASLNGETIIVEARELEKEQYAKTFTDPFDKKQVARRANALSNYFKANNFYDYIEEDLDDQIRYMNGSYQANTNEAYAMQDSILKLFDSFATTVYTNDTYISGVSENGVKVGAGLDAFILDSSSNKEIVIETFCNLENILDAKNAQELVNAANKFLSLEHQLMMGEKQNNYGEYINFDDLDPNIGFPLGILNQIGNNYNLSILGEDAQISYINNKNKEVSVFSSSIYDYYNPYQNGEVIDDNPWVGYSIDLNNNAEFLIKSYN